MMIKNLPNHLMLKILISFFERNFAIKKKAHIINKPSKARVQKKKDLNILGNFEIKCTIMTWMIYDLAVAIRSLARDLNQPFRAHPHVLFKVLK
jgi:hypothetical protein